MTRHHGRNLITDTSTSEQVTTQNKSSYTNQAKYSCGEIIFTF